MSVQGASKSSPSNELQISIIDNWKYLQRIHFNQHGKPVVRLRIRVRVNSVKLNGRFPY